MKSRILLSCAILAAIGTLVCGCGKTSRNESADDEGDQPIASASRIERGTNGATFIKLDLNTQKLIGLKTTTLVAATQTPEVAAYGRVLDPALLAEQSGNVSAARVALEASRNEYRRQKDLYAQARNTSAKALQAAQTAMERDQIALTTAQAALVTAWGTAVAGRTNLSAFVESLVRREGVLVRLDLPAGEMLPGTPTGARLVLPGMGRSTEAGFLGRAATTDPEVQGEGFIFVATNAPVALTPGLAVTGFIQLPGEPARGVIVPDAAIVRSSEQAWVYAQTGDTTFVRREITLDQPADNGWFVTNNVAPGDRLVSTGAQTLLSEERKTEIKLED